MTTTSHKWLLDYAYEVSRWLHRLYGNSTCPKRTWIEQVAVALIRQEPPPPAPKEGNTDRAWRAAPARLSTLETIYIKHRPKGNT